MVDEYKQITTQQYIFVEPQKAYAYFAGGPGIAVRCVGGALLVACQDMGDLVAAFV